VTPAVRGAIFGLVALGAAGALGLRAQRSQSQAPAEAPSVAATARLVELGSTSCQSCKAMHEELALLRQECGPSLAVQEIDVWKDEAAGQSYGVSVIPTQVFFDAQGKEIDRHVGFLARADIRQRFAQRGVECQK